MEQTSRNWMDLISKMLWMFERETKLTLRSINDEFQYNGLSFDDEFRNHFLEIVLKRYDYTWNIFIC